MPVNEILAPVYLKVRYNTGVAQHNVRVYFTLGTVVGVAPPATPNDFPIQPPGGAPSTPISTLIGQLFTRHSPVLKTGTVVEEIQIWTTAVGNNVFSALNDLPSPNLFGSVVGVAAAYYTTVFQSSDRQKFRLSLFDTIDAKPQRVPEVPPPLVDNNTVEWYMLRSDVPFATQDGKRLTQGVSVNYGYNRKLARAYGRTITP